MMARKKTRKMTESKRWLARLQKVESPDVTYVSETFPIMMKKARGMKITDVDGNSYLDFTACFGVMALGHGYPRLQRAMRAQAAKLVHGMGDVHPSASKVLLLELLARITPFDSAKSVLSLSGGEAMESALKTAMVVTGRHQFVSFSGGYHGLHFGPLALSDRTTFTRGFEPWIQDKNVVIPFPFTQPSRSLGCEELTEEFYRDTHGLQHWDTVLEKLEDALRARRIAAVVMEPLQGRGGERTWPSGFLAHVKKLAHQYGSLLVFDEIYTGLGRTGSLFALDHEGVIPDLLVLGKALGGGLPLSACVGDCLDAWGRSGGEARHTSTFLGHPLACAVGHASVNEIVRRLPEFKSELIQVERSFSKFFDEYEQRGFHKENPVQLRGRGYMCGLWFPASAPGFAAKISEQLLQLGFITLPSGPRGDVLSFTPPLIARGKEFDLVLKAVLQVLAK
jgi:4-aminobutyrate aminotransferase/(S)-3-amino-2-methylpropionate transaminase